MKNITLFLSIAIILISGSCTKTVEPGECKFKTTTGSSSNIVGKWKVVSRTSGGMSVEGRKTIDLTCSNVFYEFLKSGIVKISSDDERYQSQLGESKYSVEKKDKSISEIKINTLIWPCKVTKNQLTLDWSHGDGSKIEMYRIK